MGELLEFGAMAGEGLLGAGEAATEIAPAALGLGEAAAEAAPAALNIVPEAASFIPAAAGEVIPAAESLGALGVGAAAENAALSLGPTVADNLTSFGGLSSALSGFDAAALPLGSTVASGGPQPMATGGVSITDAGGTTAAPAGQFSFSELAAPAPGVGAGQLAPAAASVSGAPDPTATGGGWWDSLLKGASKSLTSNPLGIGLGLGGLGYNIWKGQQGTANEKALSQAAGTAAATNQALTGEGRQLAMENAATGKNLIQQGEALTQYLQTGQLPPQYMSQIDTAIKDAKTAAISNAAQQGQNVDPGPKGDYAGNSVLQQRLAQIDNQRSNMITQVASQLFSSGMQEVNTGSGTTNQTASSLLNTGTAAAGLSGQLYQALVNMDQKQSEMTAAAIGRLAQAMNAGATGKSGSGITLPGGQQLMLTG